MTLSRAAGILLHPTSLPGPNGIGELGPEAHRFVDVLADAGISIWQVLPLSPTGYGDSPYQTFSAFAGNPFLITVEDDGRVFPRHTVEFDTVIPHKRGLLERAIARFKPDVQFRDFAETEAWWLDDYALFMALKDAHGGAAWTTWEHGPAFREPAALARWRDQL